MKNSARCLFLASSPLSPSRTFLSSIEAENQSFLSYSLIARSSVLDGGVVVALSGSNSMSVACLPDGAALPAALGCAWAVPAASAAIVTTEKSGRRIKFSFERGVHAPARPGANRQYRGGGDR